MNKAKDNLFWVLIGLILIGELVAYVVAVRGKASSNSDKMRDLARCAQTLKGLESRAARQEMIDKAQKHKDLLQAEYTQMVLFLIGKDDLLDHFGEVRIAPAKARFNDRDKTKLGRFHRATREKFMTQAGPEGLGMVSDSAKQVWDFVDLAGSPPRAIWIYAYKQLWIQQALFEIMKAPVAEGQAGQDDEAAGEGGGDQSLVTVINGVQFILPDKRQEELYDPRFSHACFKLDVSMPAANVPALIERILKHELPFVVESYTVAKRLDDRGGMGIAGRPQKLVNVVVTCKVVDFAMGVSKVAFSGERFETPESVSEWLQKKAETDNVARTILGQITKTGVSPRRIGQGFEYVVYGESITDESATECEMYDGVTLYYSTIVKDVPDLRWRSGGRP